MLLTPILLIPAAVGLACLFVRSRRIIAGLGVLGFAATVVLAAQALGELGPEPDGALFSH